MPKRRRAITSPERVRKQYLSTRLALRGLSQGRSVKAGLKSLVRTESIMGLLDKAVYPKEMHPETLREMHN